MKEKKVREENWIHVLVKSPQPGDKPIYHPYTLITAGKVFNSKRVADACAKIFNRACRASGFEIHAMVIYSKFWDHSFKPGTQFYLTGDM